MHRHNMLFMVGFFVLNGLRLHVGHVLGVAVKDFVVA